VAPPMGMLTEAESPEIACCLSRTRVFLAARHRHREWQLLRRRRGGAVAAERGTADGWKHSDRRSEPEVQFSARVSARLFALVPTVFVLVFVLRPLFDPPRPPLPSRCDRHPAVRLSRAPPIGRSCSYFKQPSKLTRPYSCQISCLLGHTLGDG
jgi:hypothetical protein